MPRNLKYQRLNRSPKHRWSMLRNMTASLFLHERIFTTEAKAKSLVSAVNKIFSKALKEDRHSFNIARGWLRVKSANYKMYNDIIPRFMLNAGSITRIVRLATRRKGDGSKMAYVELLDNAHKEKEEADYNKIHKNSGLNFSKWELSTRTNQLEMYISEKEKRDEVYKQIKQKIKELKETSDVITDSDIKNALFGESLPLLKLESDPLLPHFHFFHLYLKAAKGEAELDKFYNKTNSYLKHIIREAQQQIETCEATMNDYKLSKKYERNNFLIYYENYSQDLEKVKKEYEESKEEREKRHTLLNNLANLRHSLFEDNKKTVEYINFCEAYFKKNSIDPYDMTVQQSLDFEDVTAKFTSKLEVEKQLTEENEKEYENLIRRCDFDKFVLRRLKKVKESMKKDNKDKVDPIFRVAGKGQDLPPIINIQYLSQAELNESDLEHLKKAVEGKKSEELIEQDKQKKEKAERMRLLNIHESMIRRFMDRQVKKKNKPRLWDLNDAKKDMFADIEIKEIAMERKLALSREEVISNASIQRKIRELEEKKVKVNNVRKI